MSSRKIWWFLKREQRVPKSRCFFEKKNHQNIAKKVDKNYSLKKHYFIWFRLHPKTRSITINNTFFQQIFFFFILFLFLTITILELVSFFLVVEEYSAILAAPRSVKILESPAKMIQAKSRTSGTWVMIKKTCESKNREVTLLTWGFISWKWR